MSIADLMKGKTGALDKAVVEGSGLAKPSPSAAAAPKTAEKSLIQAGMMNTTSVKPKVIGVERMPTADMVKPMRTKEEQVLFKSNKPGLSFFMDANVRVVFKNHWLLTEDKKIIEFLKDEANAKHFGVKEEKVPVQEITTKK